MSEEELVADRDAATHDLEAKAEKLKELVREKTKPVTWAVENVWVFFVAAGAGLVLHALLRGHELREA